MIAGIRVGLRGSHGIALPLNRGDNLVATVRCSIACFLLLYFFFKPPLLKFLVSSYVLWWQIGWYLELFFLFLVHSAVYSCCNHAWNINKVSIQVSAIHDFFVFVLLTYRHHVSKEYHSNCVEFVGKKSITEHPHSKLIFSQIYKHKRESTCQKTLQYVF